MELMLATWATKMVRIFILTLPCHHRQGKAFGPQAEPAGGVGANSLEDQRQTRRGRRDPGRGAAATRREQDARIVDRRTDRYRSEPRGEIDGEALHTRDNRR